MSININQILKKILEGNRKNHNSNNTFDSILGEGVVIDDPLKVSESVLIHGAATGDIEIDQTSDMVVVGVGDTGVVCGNISAHQIMIGGGQRRCFDLVIC